MAMREIFTGLPWWMKWVVVPIVGILVFGGLIAHVVGFLVGLLFNLLLLVAVVAGLVFLARKFTSSSSSRGDW
jgi:hypothetical protein